MNLLYPYGKENIKVISEDTWHDLAMDELVGMMTGSDKYALMLKRVLTNIPLDSTINVPSLIITPPPKFAVVKYSGKNEKQCYQSCISSSIACNGLDLELFLFQSRNAENRVCGHLLSGS